MTFGKALIVYWIKDFLTQMRKSLKKRLHASVLQFQLTLLFNKNKKQTTKVKGLKLGPIKQFYFEIWILLFFWTYYKGRNEIFWCQPSFDFLSSNCWFFNHMIFLCFHPKYTLKMCKLLSYPYPPCCIKGISPLNSFFLAHVIVSSSCFKVISRLLGCIFSQGYPKFLLL